MCAQPTAALLPVLLCSSTALQLQEQVGAFLRAQAAAAVAEESSDGSMGEGEVAELPAVDHAPGFERYKASGAGLPSCVSAASSSGAGIRTYAVRQPHCPRPHVCTAGLRARPKATRRELLVTRWPGLSWDGKRMLQANTPALPSSPLCAGCGHRHIRARSRV